MQKHIYYKFQGTILQLIISLKVRVIGRNIINFQFKMSKYRYVLVKLYLVRKHHVGTRVLSEEGQGEVKAPKGILVVKQLVIHE